MSISIPSNGHSGSMSQASGLVRKNRAGGASANPFVMGIVSGKGGVGKSALAVNLASSLARMGRRVLLVDADAGLANADLLLGCLPEYDLDAWCEGQAEMRDVLVKTPSGVELIVAGERAQTYRRLADAAGGSRREALSKWFGDFELVIFDLGAGIGDRVIELARATSLAWLVATPEPTSMADAYATTKRLWSAAPGLELELVVNRAHEREEGERTHQALSRLTQRFLSRRLTLRALLCEDAAMRYSIARQIAVVEDAPRSSIARQIEALAVSLVDERGWNEKSIRPAVPLGVRG